MDYNRVGTFASGFATGFKTIDDGFDRRLKREQSQRLMEMREEEFAHTKKSRQDADDVRNLSAIMHLYKNSTNAEKSEIEESFVGALNTTFPDEIGAGKKVSHMKYIPDTDSIAFGLEISTDENGELTSDPGKTANTQQSYVSENRSSDSNDRYISLNPEQLFNAVTGSSKSSDFLTKLQANIVAKGGKLADRWGKLQVRFGRVVQENKTTGEWKDKGEAKGFGAGGPGTYTEIQGARKAMQDTIASHLGDYNSVTDKYFVPEGRKGDAASAYNIAASLWNTQPDLDPRMVAYAAVTNGVMTPDVAKSMAANEYREKFGNEPSGRDGWIKHRAKTMLEDKDSREARMLRSISKEIQRFRGGMNQGDSENPFAAEKTPQASKPSDPIDWGSLPENKQAAIREAVKKGEIDEKAISKRFGDDAYRKIAGEKKAPVKQVQVTPKPSNVNPSNNGSQIAQGFKDIATGVSGVGKGVAGAAVEQAATISERANGIGASGNLNHPENAEVRKIYSLINDGKEAKSMEDLNSMMKELLEVFTKVNKREPKDRSELLAFAKRLKE